MSKGILTKREKEVFSLLIENKTTREIANILSISEKTVRNHISNTMQKLSVKGRAQAVVELIRLGEITLSHFIVLFLFSLTVPQVFGWSVRVLQLLSVSVPLDLSNTLHTCRVFQLFSESLQGGQGQPVSL